MPMPWRLLSSYHFTNKTRETKWEGTTVNKFFQKRCDLRLRCYPETMLRNVLLGQQASLNVKTRRSCYISPLDSEPRHPVSCSAKNGTDPLAAQASFLAFPFLLLYFDISSDPFLRRYILQLVGGNIAVPAWSRPCLPLASAAGLEDVGRARICSTSFACNLPATRGHAASIQ